MPARTGSKARKGSFAAESVKSGKTIEEMATGGGRRRMTGLPDWVEPQLATLTSDRFSDPGWIFERKLDGERCLAFGHRGNSYAQMVVAPYAVRAREGASVATPLHWDEVEDKNLEPGAFTLRNIPDRLAGTGDPWAGMARRRYGLARLRQRLDRLDST